MEIVLAKDLKEGDMIDLQGDIFADPNRENSLLECEYAKVESVEIETPNCVVVYFDAITVGFPKNHYLRRV